MASRGDYDYRPTNDEQDDEWLDDEFYDEDFYDDDDYYEEPPKKKCPHCGRMIPNDAVYCPYCNYKVVKTQGNRKKNSKKPKRKTNKLPIIVIGVAVVACIVTVVIIDKNDGNNVSKVSEQSSNVEATDVSNPSTSVLSSIDDTVSTTSIDETGAFLVIDNMEIIPNRAYASDSINSEESPWYMYTFTIENQSEKEVRSVELSIDVIDSNSNVIDSVTASASDPIEANGYEDLTETLFNEKDPNKLLVSAIKYQFANEDKHTITLTESQKQKTKLELPTVEKTEKSTGVTIEYPYSSFTSDVDSDNSAESNAVQNAYDAAIDLTRDDVDMRETSSGMPFATYNYAVILDQDELEWVNASWNEEHVFNQDALYNAMAQASNYYFESGQDFSSWAIRYGAPFNGIDMAVVMFGSEDNAEDNLKRTSSFFSVNYPGANFFGYMNDLDCAESNYDTTAGTYSLTINIPQALSEIGVSDRAFGYTLAMLEAYGENVVSFPSTDACSISLWNDKIADQMKTLGY